MNTNPAARYFVTTWDIDLQQFTPQRGCPTGPYSKWGVRKALRRLQELGYDTYRGAPSVRVRCTNPQPSGRRE
jgi:hypothetical protein